MPEPCLDLGQGSLQRETDVVGPVIPEPCLQFIELAGESRESFALGARPRLARRDQIGEGREHVGGLISARCGLLLHRVDRGVDRLRRGTARGDRTLTRGNRLSGEVLGWIRTVIGASPVAPGPVGVDGCAARNFWELLWQASCVQPKGVEASGVQKAVPRRALGLVLPWTRPG